MSTHTASGIGLKRLQHLVLWVSNVENSVRFYQDASADSVLPERPAFGHIPLNFEAQGGVGASVAINGANFTGASSVTFNGVSASHVVNSAAKITATVPAGATTGKIGVTTTAGTATSAGNFTIP